MASCGDFLGCVAILASPATSLVVALMTCDSMGMRYLCFASWQLQCQHVGLVGSSKICHVLLHAVCQCALLFTFGWA
jgi:hypothetical protein